MPLLQAVSSLSLIPAGHVTSPSAVGSDEHVETGPVAPLPIPSPQYSPSISHDDEIEGEGLGGSGTSVEGAFRGSKVVACEDLDGDEEMGREWEGLDEAEGGGGGSNDDWGGAWSDIDETGEEKEQVSKTTKPLPQQHEGSKQEKPSSRLTNGGVASQKGVWSGGVSLKGKLKLGSKGSQGGVGEGSPGGSTPSNPLKGRLKAEDIQRLEEQSKQNQQELDLFADMAPNITTSGTSLLLSSASSSTGGMVTSSKSTPTAATPFSTRTK